MTTNQTATAPQQASNTTAPAGAADIAHLPEGMSVDHILATARRAVKGEDSSPVTVVLTHSEDGQTGVQVTDALDEQWLAEMLGERGAAAILEDVKANGSAPLYSKRLLAEFAYLYEEDIEDAHEAGKTGDVSALFKARDTARANAASRRQAYGDNRAEAQAKAKSAFLMALVESGKLTVDQALAQL